MNIDVKDLRKVAPTLRAGQKVLLSGEIYTARDAAHKRFTAAIKNGEPLPVDIKDAVIYYAGPTPAKNGMAIGSCGPTTSARMDVHAPLLLDRGLCAVIGKGEVGKEVIEAHKRNKTVYFCAVGGAGALYSKCIEKCEVAAYEDLGCESVKRLLIKDFPLVVAIDSTGDAVFVEND